MKHRKRLQGGVLFFDEHEYFAKNIDRNFNFITISTCVAPEDGVARVAVNELEERV